MLKIVNLSYGYTPKKEVLHQVTFELRPGFTLLIGENGCGKSTLIKILTDSIHTKAKIQWGEKNLSELDRKRCMAYLPQEFDVYPSLKVKDLLKFIAKSKEVPRTSIDAQVIQAARQVNIEEYLDERVRRCSVGIRRRIGVATTLLGNPSIILMDEPTAGIDPRERSRFYRTIKSCFHGQYLLLATHVLDDMQVLADNVLMMSEGRIVFDGSYYSFRHALDGNVYAISAATYEHSEPKAKEAMTILSEEAREDGTYYHVILSESAKTSAYDQVDPSLEDIWVYHRKGCCNV